MFFFQIKGRKGEVHEPTAPDKATVHFTPASLTTRCWGLLAEDETAAPEEGLWPRHRLHRRGAPRLGRTSSSPTPGQRPLSSRRHFPAAPQRGVSRPSCTFPRKAATAQPSHRRAPCRGAEPAARRRRGPDRQRGRLPPRAALREAGHSRERRCNWRFQLASGSG